MARGVDQLSGATGAIPDGPRGLRALPGDSGLCQGPAVSNCSPGHLTLASEGPRGRPAGPDDSGSCPRAREVDLRFWVTRVRALWPAGSTSCPGRLGPGSEGPRVRPDFLGASGPGAKYWGSTNSPGRLGPGSEGPRGRPAVSEDSCSSLWARGVDQLSRVTCACVRGPEVSTSTPGPLGLVSEGPRVRTALPGESTRV